MHIETPLLASATLSRLCGSEVWLKMESAQPTGSFKLRGIGHACRVHRDRGATGFVSSSGGNAGLAVAYAGRRLGLPVSVVVPTTTQQRSIDLIQEQEAEVTVRGEDWNAAHEHALELQTDGRILVHPYDDPLLWEGHASLIDEVATAWQGEAPDLVVLSVGGGGLLCGVMQGMDRNGWSDTAVLAVETPGAASFHAACEKGQLIAIDRIDTIAACLGARQVSQQAFEYGQRPAVSSALVSDEAALSACRAFLDDHRTLVEPACGASLAVAYGQHPAARGRRRVLLIVCGGAGVTLEQLQRWSKQLEQSDDQR